ncbi:hypothetical protein HOLleu_43356 [Holothuria leucospilota]|uniref:Ig-like domain-containing protein n=1 Tax=Holothuria leucospilota TaxID=206669 RepID=A0A9Q0Y9L1_HOLLE|nr:hypothetical protein HOLleu_43356 [Holothuria leucospilota]
MIWEQNGKFILRHDVTSKEESLTERFISTITEDRFKVFLRISNVGFEDAGNYSCWMYAEEDDESNGFHPDGLLELSAFDDSLTYEHIPIKEGPPTEDNNSGPLNQQDRNETNGAKELQNASSLLSLDVDITERKDNQSTDEMISRVEKEAEDKTEESNKILGKARRKRNYTIVKKS